MIRKAIIALLAFVALVAVLLWVATFFWPMPSRVFSVGHHRFACTNAPQGGLDFFHCTSLSDHPHLLPVSYFGGVRFRFAGISLITSHAGYLGSYVPAQRLHIPQWPFLALALVFSIYPALAFIRGPVRRWRRRKRGLCIRCGYNLTGLAEPRCPECGRAI